MKLLTKEILKTIPELGEQESLGEKAIVHVKYFLTGTCATWYATEYSQKEKLFFGWAEIVPGCGEYGYFSITQLESIKNRLGLGVERDLYYEKITIGEAVRKHKRLFYENSI
jgi:hypothetical protein